MLRSYIRRVYRAHTILDCKMEPSGAVSQGSWAFKYAGIPEDADSPIRKGHIAVMPSSVQVEKLGVGDSCEKKKEKSHTPRPGACVNMTATRPCPILIYTQGGGGFGERAKGGLRFAPGAFELFPRAFFRQSYSDPPPLDVFSGVLQGLVRRCGG